MENNLRYLLLGRVLPEIGMFATDGQRKTALRHALSVTSHGSSRLWAWTLLYVLAVVGTIYVGFYLETRSPVASEIASKLMPLALAATCLWFCRSVLRKRLRILLAARGVPICIPCGYDLRGQVAARTLRPIRYIRYAPYSLLSCRNLESLGQNESRSIEIFSSHLSSANLSCRCRCENSRGGSK